MTSSSEPQPGWCVGPDQSPDEYTLIRPVTSGGEGDVWLARRIEADGRRRGGDWAVKMLLPGHPALSKAGFDPQELLNKWDQRWYRNQLDSSELRSVPGVVLPTQTFNGPLPHPRGGRRPGNPRGLYMVTPWVDGADLRAWRKTADQRGIANTIGELCRIVDALHDRGSIHGDISPGNVMVEPDGRVSLIDFTFMRFTDISRHTVALTPGYGAPEGLQESTMATDAYAVAAVAYFLLTGTMLPTDPRTRLPTRDAQQVAERVLTGRGWSPTVAGHVAVALSAQPGLRPVPLRPWGERLASLITAEAGRVTCLEVVSDTRDNPVLLTGSLLGLSATGPWTPPPGGPSGLVDVAAETDGTGRLVVFALDGQGMLWSAVDDRWQQIGDVPMRGRLAMLRTPGGAVVCFMLGRDGLLGYRLDAAQSDYTRTLLESVPGTASEIQAATIAPNGWGALLIRDRTGLHCHLSENDTLERVLDGEVRDAAVGISQWGDLEVVAARDGGLVAVEQLSSAWAPPEPIDCPVPVNHLAVLDHREGRTIAVAGPLGLWVATGGQWSCLDPRPADCPVLRPTRGWRMQLAAIVEGTVAYWAEDHAKRWVRQEPR